MAQVKWLVARWGKRDARPFIGWHAGDRLRQQVGCRKVRVVLARDRGGKAQPALACLGRIEADENIFESH